MIVGRNSKWTIILKPTKTSSREVSFLLWLNFSSFPSHSLSTTFNILTKKFIFHHQSQVDLKGREEFVRTKIRWQFEICGWVHEKFMRFYFPGLGIPQVVGEDDKQLYCLDKVSLSILQRYCKILIYWCHWRHHKV